MACPKDFAILQTIGPGNTPSVPKHIRPASRDVSNDARSGNANRHVMIRCLAVQMDVQTNNHNQSSDMTASARGVSLATTKQLSDTIFSSQCMQNSTANAVQTFFSRMNVSRNKNPVRSTASATARRPLLAAPSGASPKGVRREDRKWWSLSGSNR